MRAVTVAAFAVFAGMACAHAAELPQFEVSAATLPRLDAFEGASRNVMVSLLPNRVSGIGLAFGISSTPVPIANLGQGTTAYTTMDLGVHWRYTLDSNYRFDVTAYRRVPNSDAMSLIESHDPSYGARFEMSMGKMGRTKGKGFTAERGFVGFQLESGARLTIKRSGGKPMLYYRNDF